MKILKAAFRLLALTLFAVHFSDAAGGAQAVVGVPQMIVEPSATRVSVAKAKLIVSPLTHQQESYRGKYQLKVTPFSSKSEQGTLSLDTSHETLRKMSEGKAVEFSGKATNVATGTIKVVTGRTSPQANDHGDVTFSVQTVNGPMVFNTSYHLVTRQ